MSRRVAFHTLMAWSVAASVLAGPPLEFDDPDTPGAGSWEINLASTMAKRANLWEFKPLLAAAGRTIHEPRGERPATFSYLGLQLTF